MKNDLKHLKSLYEEIVAGNVSIWELKKRGEKITNTQSFAGRLFRRFALPEVRQSRELKHLHKLNGRLQGGAVQENKKETPRAD